MSTWECPNCKREYKDGDYPDHWGGCNEFEFDCECGTTFEVAVDWFPHFWVNKASAKCRVVNVGDELHQVLADALGKTKSV